MKMLSTLALSPRLVRVHIGGSGRGSRPGTWVRSIPINNKVDEPLTPMRTRRRHSPKQPGDQSGRSNPSGQQPAPARLIIAVADKKGADGNPQLLSSLRGITGGAEASVQLKRPA